MSHDIEPGDELDLTSVCMTIVRRHDGGGITRLPVSFRGLADYFAWIRRNASHLPPEFVRQGGMIEAAWLQQQGAK